MNDKPTRRFLRREPKNVEIAKLKAELDFWKNELKRYVRWYRGLGPLYGIESPRAMDKLNLSRNDRESACIAWNDLFQKRKYLVDLGLEERCFTGKRIIDIGAGPHPSALCYVECEVFGLDPLMSWYERIGYPIHAYDKRYHYIQGVSEKMPFQDSVFDAVVSVNAIDHVADLKKSASEIRRVLKPDGAFRMHVHYHSQQITEPLELSDEVFLEAFDCIGGLRKICESSTKDMGYSRAGQGESYVVWSNL